jgi:hypothetical protein
LIAGVPKGDEDGLRGLQGLRIETWEHPAYN